MRNGRRDTERELRSGLRRSLRVLPIGAGMTAAVAAILVLWRPWPLWIAFGVLLLTLIGDLINVAYCRAKLRGIDPGGSRDGRPPES